jgi:hypothetical protein
MRQCLQKAELIQKISEPHPSNLARKGVKGVIESASAPAHRWGLPIIGKLLGHSQAATTHRYAHLDADPMRRAVETIGVSIVAAMDSGKGR